MSRIRTDGEGGAVLSRWISVAAIGVIAGLGLPSAAAAQGRPSVTVPPTTTGSAVVGSTLTSTGGRVEGPRGTRSGRAWLRCTTPDEWSCVPIDRTWDQSTYRVTGADVGRRIRSALYACRDCPRDMVWRLSAPTAVVTQPAPPPAPTPVPTPEPAPEPPPAPVEPPPPPAAQPLPTEQAAPPPAPAAPARAKRMRPFPVVRISGVLTTNGAQISRLTIKAPKGTRITISCSGKGCPKQRVKRAGRGKSIHVPALETHLRAGIRLTITVSRKGYIAKVTTIRIRRAKAPLRSDLCREPGAKKRTRCPK